MNLKKLAENISVAMIAQMVNMLVSIATVILAPKVMGAEQYGYWQLFIFYGSYVGLFQLGINDGVYLLNGGVERDSINRRSIASQFWFSVAYQLAMVTAVIPFVLNANFGGSREFVLLAIAIFLVIYNATSYIGYVFQAMNETKVYSRSVILERGLLFVGLCILLALGIESFEPYIVTFVVTKACALAYCLLVGRGFVFLKPYSLLKTAHIAGSSIKVGAQLLVAVNAGSLVVGVARFVIDSSWSIETFGMVSFSLSIVNFIMAFIGQVSMVLFPALRQCSPDELKRYYIKCRDLLTVMLPAALVLYWPARLFVNAWLPGYSDAVYFMGLLAPLCVFDGRMNILCTTYFKVLRMETTMLAINLATLVVSACGCMLVAALGLPVEAVLITALFSVAMRCVVSEEAVSRRMRLGFQRSPILSVLPVAVFIAAGYWLGALASFVVYVIFLFALIILNRNTLSELAVRLRFAHKNDSSLKVGKDEGK